MTNVTKKKRKTFFPRVELNSPSQCFPTLGSYRKAARGSLVSDMVCDVKNDQSLITDKEWSWNPVFLTLGEGSGFFHFTISSDQFCYCFP